MYHHIGMVGDGYFWDGALKVMNVYLLQALVHLHYSLTALFFGCKLMMIEAVILHSLYFVIGFQYCLIAVIKMLDTVNYTTEFYKFFYRRSASIGIISELICNIIIFYVN